MQACNCASPPKNSKARIYIRHQCIVLVEASAKPADDSSSPKVLDPEWPEVLVLGTTKESKHCSK